MKLLVRLLLIIGVVAVGLLCLRDTLVKRGLQRALEEQTGFRLEMAALKLGLWTSSFEIRDARLLNPADFPDPDAVQIERIKVDYDFWSLFSREIRFSEVVLDIPKLVVVKKADGETNTERLSGKGGESRGGHRGGEKPGPAPQPKGEPRPEPEAKPETKARDFRIATLVVKVGAVEYRDYTKAKQNGEPGVTTVTLNMDQEHHDITSLGQLGGLILGTSLQKFGLRIIGPELQDPDSELNKKIKKTADKVQRELNKLFGGQGE